MIKTGPAVGTHVPVFQAIDQGGHVQTLASISGPKGSLLVFFRSADWWPFCKAQLVELQQNYQKIRSTGRGLAAISYDSPAVLENFAERRNVRFPLLSDSDSKIIRRFGILNTQTKEGSTSYGIPYPGIYVLDAKGVVTAKYFEDDYKQRDTAAIILMKEFGLQPTSTAFRLMLSTYC